MEHAIAGPALPGLNWRPVTVADLAALSDLAAACYRADGGIAFLNEPENLKWRYFRDAPGAGTGAFDDNGHLVACTTVRVEREAETARARIAGQVHPDWRHRGIGTYLLRWSVEQANALSAATPPGSRLLEIATETLTAAAGRLYRSHGFAPVMEELVLRRDLRRPLPECPLPEGVTLAGWQPGLARHFYQAYHASFRDRPGFPGWSAEKWIAWTADDNLRPEWSLLASAAGEPLGFVTAGVEHHDSFIMQVGVIPEQRRRGLASALMVEAMQRMHAGGETATELTVNLNNPGAVQTYLQLGFIEKGRRARYQREVGPAGPSGGAAVVPGPTEELAEAEIPVEQINGPVLLISGTADGLWPSTMLSEIARERLAAHDHPYPYAHLVYEEAGHWLPVPYRPVTVDPATHPVTGVTVTPGGTRAASAQSGAEAWAEVLAFLEAALAP